MPDGEQQEQRVFSAGTLERYRKVRTLAENKAATDGERASAQRRLREMEAKYPSLKAAVDIKDEVERRKRAPPPGYTPPPWGPRGAPPPGPHASRNPNEWQGRPEDVPPWNGHGYNGFPGYRGPGGFRPGHGPNPFDGAPRARDAVPPVDQGEDLWKRAVHRAQQAGAEFVDDIVDRARRAWDEMAEEEVRRERGEPPSDRAGTRRNRAASTSQDNLKNRANEAVREAQERLRDPAQAAQRRARRDYYDMGNLQDLLDDPMVTEAGVAFEIDPDTDEPCFRFDVSIPNRVWRRLRRNPKLFMRWLDDLKADGEDEMAERERRKREGGGYDDPEGPDDDEVPDDDDLEGEAFEDDDVPTPDTERPNKGKKKR